MILSFHRHRASPIACGLRDAARANCAVSAENNANAGKIVTLFG
jgi:hypothetical protein